MIKEILTSEILDRLKQLPRKQLLTFLLLHNAKLSFEQAAKMLNSSKLEILDLYKKAILNIKKYLLVN